MTYKELIKRAEEAMWTGYAPYSRYRVGAAIECRDGTVFTGCNIENAAYGECLCAERVAAAKAVSAGRTDFMRIAVISDSDEYCMPCGSCRQFLSEFSRDMEFLCARKDTSYVCYSMKDLLPHAFSSEILY